ncbi:hypothetical protein [Xenorhabdus sp. KJ12.1]|uniref:hypothetical protein n=1 Tax=Xenorhabdus sp. KJ12.1 TaxID=1851571 RepID=UPI000C03AE69|nr:hypothetical protein [Xenorhabdus sp. KJ12.1]PHM72368.1 hypothetical protein Xekj_00647 [Xenorhabdus sp. KJ12.1]
MHEFIFKRQKMIFIINIILFISAVKSYAAFDANDPINKRVSFFLQTSTEQTFPYSSSYNYGSQIRYYIHNQNVIDSQGTQGLSVRFYILRSGVRVRSIDIALNPHIEMAVNYFNAILRDQNFSITPAQNRENSNFIIRRIPDDLFRNTTFVRVLPAGSENLNWLSTNRPFSNYITSSGIYFRTSTEYPEDQLFVLRYIFGDYNEEVLLGNLVYTIILHEFGHALGLAHPDDPNITGPVQDADYSFDNLEIGVTYTNVPQPALMRRDPSVYLQNLYTYINANNTRSDNVILRMIGLSDNERRWIRAMINCRRNYQLSELHSNSNLSDLQCNNFSNDFTVIYPLAQSLIPITNILLMDSTPKPKIKVCEVELNTTKTWALSSWYSTFTTNSGCQLNIKLFCDGSQNKCSPSTGDYSSENKFQVIIYDDEKNYKQEPSKREQNSEKTNMAPRSINLESTDNMKFENKGSGIAKISYITSSCYYDTGPSSFEVKPNLDRAFTVTTKNDYNIVIRWLGCWNSDKTISWKIEYTTYE